MDGKVLAFLAALRMHGDRGHATACELMDFYRMEINAQLREAKS